MEATLISSRGDIPPKWFFSIITCEEERKIGNPTVLQVAARITSHLIISLENPEKVLCIVIEKLCEK